MSTLGGIQKMLTFTEQGFYFFVNRSDKPKALPLQKWVAGDVLPSIRKTGSYSLPGAQPAPERPLPVSAALRSRINGYAWRLAQASFEDYRTAMLHEAQVDPDFNPQQWTPPDFSLSPQSAIDTDLALANVARQRASESRYRTRNPQRDYEVLRLRLLGLSYREIGREMRISEVHAWRIVNRQGGKLTRH